MCRAFFSYTLDCLGARIPHYTRLCEQNMHAYATDGYVACAFFREVVQQCGNRSYVWNVWRAVTSCRECSAPMCRHPFPFVAFDLFFFSFFFPDEPTCPGDLVYVAEGPAFPPSCSSPDPSPSDRDLVGSCVCPKSEEVPPAVPVQGPLGGRPKRRRVRCFSLTDAVLNDHEDGFGCVSVPSCPCVFAGKSYSPGDARSTRCQTW